MAGKSPVTVDEEQRSALIALSRSRDRGEADRARAILLTLSGWTSGQIAEAFGVREDTVRFWRSAFTAGGVEALKKSRPGPKRQSGDARRARLGSARAHCSHQPDQTKLRLHRAPGGGRSALWSQARGRDPADRARPG